MACRSSSYARLPWVTHTVSEAAVQICHDAGSNTLHALFKAAALVLNNIQTLKQTQQYTIVCAVWSKHRASKWCASNKQVCPQICTLLKCRYGTAQPKTISIIVLS
jgi:hypothetical protein